MPFIQIDMVDTNHTVGNTHPLALRGRDIHWSCRTHTCPPPSPSHRPPPRRHDGQTQRDTCPGSRDGPLQTTSSEHRCCRMCSHHYHTPAIHCAIKEQLSEYISAFQNNNMTCFHSGTKSAWATLNGEKERPARQNSIALKWVPWATGSALIRQLCGTANRIHKPRLPNVGNDRPQTLSQRCSGLLSGVRCSFAAPGGTKEGGILKEDTVYC